MQCLSVAASRQQCLNRVGEEEENESETDVNKNNHNEDADAEDADNEDESSNCWKFLSITRLPVCMLGLNVLYVYIS